MAITPKKAAPAPKKPAPPATKTAVAKVPEPPSTKVVLAEQQAMLERDALQDRDTFGRDDLATPFLRVLQPLSPQTQRGHEKYVEGAEPGMFIDTADNELWDGEEGIVILPVHYTPSYIEWKLREAGGGLVKDHGAVAPDLPTHRDDKNRELLPSGNQLVKSGLYFVFLIDPDTGNYKQLAFPLAGMQLKKSRQWNTRMKSIKIPRGDDPSSTFVPAIFYTAWKITTQFESNEKGSWHGVNIEPLKPVPQLGSWGWSVYKAAQEFKAMIARGDVKVKPMEADEEIAEVVHEDGETHPTGSRGKEPF